MIYYHMKDKPDACLTSKDHHPWQKKGLCGSREDFTKPFRCHESKGVSLLQHRSKFLQQPKSPHHTWIHKWLWLLEACRLSCRHF